MKPNLNYGDEIFDKAYNNIFQQRYESLQYKASLALTGVIRGSSAEKLYEELGQESLQNRRRFRKLYIFKKLIKNSSQNIYLT